MGFNIAIDGPAGAGKSTIAKLAAKELGFMYVDTGALYRAIAYRLMQKGIDAEDERRLAEALAEMDVRLGHIDGQQRVYVDDADVTTYIRGEEVGKMASSVSGYPFVREKLLSIQQETAKEYDVIMDGRDIGTCVLPDAPLKIFLTAAPHERAKRRYEQLIKKGESPDIDVIEKDIRQRDEQDMTRSIAPLKAAEDAKVIDSTNMSIEDVVGAIRMLYKDTADERS